jgi:O-6-methylguanine DNA methyltransferase
MLYKTMYETPVGRVLLAADGENLIGLWLEGQKYFGGGIREAMQEKNNLPVFENTKKWLDRYFKGEKPSPYELPLAPIGSDFRQEVWKILCAISYGEVTTYGAIGKRLGKKNMSGQAVGGAVGHNPISIIIPCHRVLGANGSLTGYAGGLSVKKKLLELEGALPAPFI